MYVHPLFDEEAAEEDAGDGESVAFQLWTLPSLEFDGLWESLVYDEDVQPRLLRYVSTAATHGKLLPAAMRREVNRVPVEGEGDAAHGPRMSGRLVGGKDLERLLQDSAGMRAKMERESWSEQQTPSKGAGMYDAVQEADRQLWADWNEAEDARFPRGLSPTGAAARGGGAADAAAGPNTTSEGDAADRPISANDTLAVMKRAWR